MAWFGLAKMALQAGAKVYANKQRTKMAMSDAQLMHAERQARGEESVPGQIIGSPTERLQRRIRLGHNFGADHCACMGGKKISVRIQKNRK